MKHSYSTKKSKKEELEANLRNDDGDLIGEALIEFDDDDMTIDIELDDLPNACDSGDCFIAIHRGSRCGNKKGLYFDGQGPNDSDNPWTPFESDFESDDGEASFDFETSNGRDYDDNLDRVMVIYAKKPRRSSKKSKSHHTGPSASKSHHTGPSASKSHHRALTAEGKDELSQRELGHFFAGGRRRHRNRHHGHSHSNSHDDDDWDFDDYKDIACGKLKKA